MLIPTSMLVAKNRGKVGRHAFTLLEVLLSAAIGVLLMAALYVAMNVQLDHAQAGREAVEQSLLVRALLRRMSNDIAPSLAADPPANYSSGGGMGGGGMGVGGGSTPQAGSTANGTNTGTPSASGNAGSSPISSSTTAPVLNLQGDTGRLILWVSRLSSDLSAAAPSQTVTSDLHRVTYWMASGSLGLARQEVKQATSDDALLTAPPDIADETTYVIAEEVQGVNFRYWDGTTWQDSWDGTQVTAANGTPLGPPLAVEITLTIAIPDAQGLTGGNSNVKTYRHVVGIPTANGTSSASTSTTTTQ